VLQVTSFFWPSRYQPDFDTYHRTIQDMSAGINPYTVSYMQNLGPPAVFIYHLPFSLFSLSTAQQLNLSINIVAGYLACWILAYRFFSRLRLTAFLVICAVLYGSFLSRYSLQIGQPILVLTLLISTALSSRSRIVSSLALACASITKAFLAFTYLAMVSRPTALTMGLLGICAILVVSFPIVRPSWYLYYSQQKFPATISAPDSTTRFLNYENQTLRTSLTRLKIQHLYPFAWGALFIIGAITVYRRRSLPLGILFSFLLTPVLWQYYLAALLPLFVLALIRHPSWLLLASVVLWFPDLSFLHTALPTFFNGLLASHFYISIGLLTLNYLHTPRNSPAVV